MNAAVVTVTCPKCGGEAKGIKPSGTAQVIPCTYCGMELHIPRIGKRESSEIRVPYEETQTAVDEQSRSTTGLVVVIGCVTIVLGVFVFADGRQDSRSTNVVEDFDRRQVAREKCIAECKDACKDAPRQTQKSAPRYGVDPDSNPTMQKAERMLCESECEQRCEMPAK
ncbi:MAG: hypothetical protein IPM54_40130 [Polyangiaceae bacterium]|nr:hypothetical protein [Polyangiaceae bacterium]